MGKAREKVLREIARCHGATCVGLVASSVRLSPRTVERHVEALIAEGLVEKGPCEPGYSPPLLLTVPARRAEILGYLS